MSNTNLDLRKLLPHKIKLHVPVKLKKLQKQEKENGTIVDRGNKFNMSNLNSFDDTKKYPKWKELDIDIKKEKINVFFENKEKYESIQKCYDLIDDNKLYLKKDIYYDNINQRIIDIFVFNADGEKKGKQLNVKQKKHEKIQKKQLDKDRNNRKLVSKLFK